MSVSVPVPVPVPVTVTVTVTARFPPEQDERRCQILVQHSASCSSGARLNSGAIKQAVTRPKETMQRKTAIGLTEADYRLDRQGLHSVQGRV